MKSLTTKQLARRERKKEKIAALVAISRLNSLDRLQQVAPAELEKGEMADSNGPLKKKQRKEEQPKEDYKNEQHIEVQEVQLQSDDGHVGEVGQASVEELTSLKTEYNELKRKRRACPGFRLKENGELASFDTKSDERVPIVLTDIQHLLLFSLLGEQCPYRPSRWCQIDRYKRLSHTVALVLEGVSSHDYIEHEMLLDNMKKLFRHKLEVITPCIYGGSLVEELAAVPLNEEEKDSLISKYGSIEAAMEARKDLMIMIKAVFPIVDALSLDNTSENGRTERAPKDTFPRTQLLLSAWQLVEEKYPLPLKGKLSKTYGDYVMTKDCYKPVSPTSPMFGLDCEMCLTSAGSELTRVSIVNENHETVYERLVLPYNRIFNYLTQYSGITEQMLNGVTTRLEDVQCEIKELLPSDAILVGQSLSSDMHALKMMHPYVIDTSVIFNLTGERVRKSKLKILAKEFLKEDIQHSKNGHCSVEDSLASLKLVQLKLSKSMDYGDAVLASRKKCEEKYSHLLTESPTNIATTIFNHMTQKRMSSMVVGCEDIISDYYEYLNRIDEDKHSLKLGKKYKQKKVKLNTMNSQTEVVGKVCQSAKDHNLTLAHLKIHVGQHIRQIVLKQLDQWVGEIWSSMAPYGLFVLVLGGDNVHNGMSFITIKSFLNSSS